jgi:hypothetical protein
MAKSLICGKKESLKGEALSWLSKEGLKSAIYAYFDLED